MSLLRDPNYRPSFSGHETFPLKYGWLQKAYRAVNEADSPAKALNSFRDPSAISYFGVGRNMVNSIRYWATHTSVITEDDSGGLVPGALGDLLFGVAGIDHYLEEIGSLWLVHWNLASRAKLTTLYWLFNEFTGGVFLRREVVNALRQFSREMEWSHAAEETVDRDIQCFIKSYVGPRNDRESRDSILSELGLIRPLGGGKFGLTRNRQLSLPNCVFLYSVWDYWRNLARDQNTLSYESIAFSGRSPGRVFLLDEISLFDRLEEFEALTDGAIIWSETAGLKQLVKSRGLDENEMENILKDALHSVHKDKLS